MTQNQLATSTATNVYLRHMISDQIRSDFAFTTFQTIKPDQQHPVYADVAAMVWGRFGIPIYVCVGERIKDAYT